MNFKVVSMKGGFPPDIGRIINESLARVQMRALGLARDTVGFVRGITPSRSGFMKSTVRHWNLRIYGRGGFVFWFGWRRGDYAGQKAFYPLYVDLGTGVYGLYGVPIFPLHATHLAWIHGGRWVSARFVAGQRPQRLLEKGKEFAQERLRDIYQYEVSMGMKRTFK